MSGETYKVIGDIAKYASEIIAPSLLSGVVKDQIEILCLEMIRINTAIITTTIFDLIPEP